MLDYFKQVLGLEKIYFSELAEDVVRLIVFCDISSTEESSLLDKILAAIGLKKDQVELRATSEYQDSEGKVKNKLIIFTENYLLFESVNSDKNKIFIPTLLQMLKEESLKKQAWMRLKGIKI
jgi:hypothetical protein